MIELRYTWQGLQCENTLYVEAPAVLTPALLSNIAAFTHTWWESNIQTLQSDTLVLREIHVTDLTTAVSPTFTLAGDVNDFGGATLPSMPNSVSFAISFRTAGRGRSSRGRNYFCGLTESQVAGNTVAPSVVAALQAAYAAFLATVDATVYTWVVVSRFADGLPRTTGLTQPVTSVVITDSTVDSQRRRLP